MEQGKIPRESLIKSGRIILGCKMIKVKARNASNSMAIAKFRNAEVNYFVPKMIDHDLIRGSLVAQFRPDNIYQFLTGDIALHITEKQFQRNRNIVITIIGRYMWGNNKIGGRPQW